MSIYPLTVVFKKSILHSDSTFQYSYHFMWHLFIIYFLFPKEEKGVDEGVRSRAKDPFTILEGPFETGTDVIDLRWIDWNHKSYPFTTRLLAHRITERRAWCYRKTEFWLQASAVYPCDAVVTAWSPNHEWGSAGGWIWTTTSWGSGWLHMNCDRFLSMFCFVE